jgi:hypothetical protein
MSKQQDRLARVAEDIEFVEEGNELTEHQRQVSHDFELLLISAEMQHNTKLFNLSR